ncbi:MAG TPA: hypothetical protein VNO70_06695 [Blastocatellia bacterium]|nr:hypothetical protein [Blastocatellia bacterium]
MPLQKFWHLLFILLSLAVASPAQGTSYAPKPGSAERKAIMDALRAPVEKELRKKTIFKIDHIKAQDGWAFVRGVPRQPDGSPMDYKGTVYEEAIKEGIFDDWICALLRRKGETWEVVTYAIGATDVPYDGWDKEFKAPSAIFK